MFHVALKTAIYLVQIYGCFKAWLLFLLENATQSREQLPGFLIFISPLTSGRIEEKAPFHAMRGDYRRHGNH